MNNGPSIITCPKCKMRVLPKMDGTCPSCQAVIANRVAVPQKQTNTQTPPSHTTPVVLEPALVQKKKSSQAARKTKFHVGDIIFNALKVTWKFKILWILPMIISIAAMALLVYLFIQPWLAQGEQLDVSKLVVSYLGFPSREFMILLILTGFLGIPIRSMIVLGVKKIDSSAMQFNLSALIQENLKYFWRILGLIFALPIGIGLIIVFSPLLFPLIFNVVFSRTAQSIMTVVWLLYVLMIPFLIGISGVIQYSVAALILEGSSVKQAVKKAWELVTRNKKNTVLLSLAITGGELMLMGITTIPFSTILLRLTEMSITSRADSSAILFYILAGLYFCGYAFLLGVLSVYSESAWTLSFLRLTKSFKTSVPIIPEVPDE